MDSIDEKMPAQEMTIIFEKPKFTIGTKFVPYDRKRNSVYEIVDIILSVSYATGEVSHVLSYIGVTEVMGQMVKCAFPQATISRSELINEE